MVFRTDIIYKVAVDLRPFGMFVVRSRLVLSTWDQLLQHYAETMDQKGLISLHSEHPLQLDFVTSTTTTRTTIPSTESLATTTTTTGTMFSFATVASTVTTEDDTVVTAKISNPPPGTPVHVAYYLMTLPMMSERRTTMTRRFKQLDAPLEVVIAVNGKKMDSDPRAVALFADQAKGTPMHNTEYGENWTFDGRPSTGFGLLSRNGHQGIKGLWLSNILAMQVAVVTQPEANDQWACILESDAVIDEATHRTILLRIRHHSMNHIVLFDGWRGACAVCYRLDVLRKVERDLRPMAHFAMHSELSSNLWDWLLFDYVRKMGAAGTLSFHNAGQVVRNGDFDSTIS